MNETETATESPTGFKGFLARRWPFIIDAGVLAACVLFLCTYFPPSLLLLDTTPTGGDVPAHNYMVSRLMETLPHGQIISFASGWWSGFPMFQYYFFLPYLAMAIAGYVIPVNIAFKIGSVFGLFALPFAMYFGIRQIRSAPRAAAPVLAAMSLPFMFVQTHTMWGVNVKSTLAGMIANSWSFCLMVLFLGYALRDLEDGKRRISTIILLTLLFYSHFFTTLIAVMVIGACTLVLFPKHFWRSVGVMLPTGVIAVLCASFWLIPLMAKGAWSIEFGGDWDEVLIETFPAWARYAWPFALVALGAGAWKRSRAVGMFVLMFGISLVLWFYGGRINSSFGNIRFWPFIFFAFVGLVGLGIAYLFEPLKLDRVAVAASAGIILALLSAQPDEVSGWFKWNMDGVQRKRPWPILRAMIDEMKGTPGRFVVDQTGVNNQFGSDRVFEAMPAMIGKPFVVGGIVNSATGALFGYSVQCEISKGCAGFPKLVAAPEFDVDLALRHMDLFSVSHIVAHYGKLKRDMRDRENWTLAKKVPGYHVYARAGGATPYVFIPPYNPAVLETDAWKERGIEWFAAPAMLERMVAFIEPGETIADEKLSMKLNLAEFFSLLARSRPDLTEIPAWSMLGPLYHPPKIDDPYEYNPHGLEEPMLRPGRKIAGMRWRPLVRRGRIDVDTMVNPSHHMIIYAYTAIFSDEDQDARLHLASDDEIRVFYNGGHLVDAPRHEPKSPKTVPIRLNAGRNDLIIKLNQGVGGAFYHARLTTPDGEVVPGVRFGPEPQAPPPPVARDFDPTPTDCKVDVLEFEDERVRFTTTCPGEPHVVKYSYFPNWKVKGAKRIYQVSPNFMLVYPRENDVTLYYGSLFVDSFSRFLTFAGYAILAGMIVQRVRARRREKV
ncbi:hypothetical protein K8I61_14725 [bacterium]|nr:hypothetical protein [bacterium]